MNLVLHDSKGGREGGVETRIFLRGKEVPVEFCVLKILEEPVDCGRDPI